MVNMASETANEKLQIELDYERFRNRYPEYAQTAAVDRLRATEYRRLDEQGQVYLDYTGGSLYSESQLDQHLALLRSGVFGNPHSTNPTSTAMTRYVERTRQSVLNYFGTSAAEYILAFTQNASGALKLIGESFPFAPGSRLLLTFDNHNSVNGIREFARTKGATVAYAPLLTPTLRLDRNRLDALMDQADPARENLFAYPAQSNFSGVKHPFDLVARAQAKGWRVLLDAAAYVPTNRLDLTAALPDFVTVDGPRQVSDSGCFVGRRGDAYRTSGVYDAREHLPCGSPGSRIQRRAGAVFGRYRRRSGPDRRSTPGSQCRRRRARRTGSR
jgi:molybdenum cofactor sulfurtransferase